MKFSFFRKHFCHLFVIGACLFSSGCVYLAVASVGALGGYVISPDTVEGIVARSQEEVWDAAYDICSIMGGIEVDNATLGQMSALISGARVEVTIVPVNLTTSKLTIKARKTWMPRIAVAQDVYAKIVGSLEE